MNATVHSPHWHRVAELKPRLRATVRLQRRELRGETWYLLSDPLHGRHHLIDQAAYRLAGRLDGQRSLQDIWHSASEALPEQAPTQDEFLTLLAQLNEAELLQGGVLPDLGETFQRRERSAQRRRHAALNPLAMRLPLGDPRLLLSRLTPRLARLGLFSPLAALGVGLFLLASLMLALVEAQGLAAHAARLTAGREFLWMSWLAYPCIKALHELAHALLITHWGGEVRRCGVAMLMLLPAPFVDGSSAWEFASRRRRVAVSLAGVAAELVLAALALWVWVLVQPGLVRDAALVVAGVASISTLLVNANPLLRFDGYHALCDAASLPNLAARSRAWWLALLRRRLFKVADAASPATGRGEAGWLMAYAPLSLAWAWVLSAGVLLWVAERSALLGLLLAITLGYLLAFRPASQGLRYLLTAPELALGLRSRALGVSAALALGALALLLVPLPAATRAQGIAWLPEDALLRVGSEGFVSTLHVQSGQRVKAGEVLITLEDAQLSASAAAAQAEADAALVEYRAALERELARAQGLLAEYERRSADALRLAARLDGLQLRASRDGPVSLVAGADLQGKLVRKGEVLGYVLAQPVTLVKVAVPHGHSLRVREHTRGVQVWPQVAGTRAHNGGLVAEVPAASDQLPAAALGQLAGGELATDPADKNGLRTLEPVAVLDVMVPHLVPQRLGERLQVRFDHGLEPLGLQVLRAGRQLLLRHVEGGHTGAALRVAGGPT